MSLMNRLQNFLLVRSEVVVARLFDEGDRERVDAAALPAAVPDGDQRHIVLDGRPNGALKLSEIPANDKRRAVADSNSYSHAGILMPGLSACGAQGVSPGTGLVSSSPHPFN